MAPFSLYLFASLLCFVSAVSITTDSSPPPPLFSASTPPPAAAYSFSDQLKQPPFSPFTSITPVLTDLGYHHLAMAANSIFLSSNFIPWFGPVTIFAPADSSIRTCPSCSISLLLQEHIVPGLYPLDYLRKLPFGTKIETILAGRCVTITTTANPGKIFIGGAEITRPDLFNNGHLIIHGVQGYISHLSPYSCSINKMTSLTVPMQSPESSLIRLMLADAMIRLRTGGYSVLALALRIKYPELVSLHNMTIFALDDASIFHGGHAYVRDVKFHIIPNCLMKLSDIETLPAATILPTLLPGEFLTVTTPGGGGVLSPLRVNYVRIKIPDLMYNLKIVVHGLALPFPHLHGHHVAFSGRSGFNHPIGTEFEPDDHDQESLGKPTDQIVTTAPSPVIESTVEMDYHHGL